MIAIEYSKRLLGWVMGSPYRDYFLGKVMSFAILACASIKQLLPSPRLLIHWRFVSHLPGYALLALIAFAIF